MRVPGGAEQAALWEQHTGLRCTPSWGAAAGKPVTPDLRLAGWQEVEAEAMGKGTAVAHVLGRLHGREMASFQ